MTVPRAASPATGPTYVGYTYSYPHKTAHRPLEPARSLSGVWANEDKSGLFLYLHVPFCEMRCGFCNLFSVSGLDERFVERYLDALARQAAIVKAHLGPATVARVAVGGGTPTCLAPAQLERLLAVSLEVFGVRPGAVPVSVETSPATVTAERLAILRDFGVDRVSLGVQAFDEAEVQRLGRPQRSRAVEVALDALRSFGFETLNLDLVYGGAGQTIAEWRACLDRALGWAPEEIYLYPLYVRPLTGLGRARASLDRRAPLGVPADEREDPRVVLYREGREHLLARGYRQVSMRMFVREDPSALRPQEPRANLSVPVYRCQEDGMVGLGCGARSYTHRLHYAWPYAVGRAEVRRILTGYLATSDDAFGKASFGIELDRQERARRYVLLSLLQEEGLDLARYRQRFFQSPWDDLPELARLESDGLIERSGAVLRLTEVGLERSDAIGPWLYSAPVRRRMEAFEWR